MSMFQLSYILLWLVVCVLLIGIAALYSAFGVLLAQRARIGSGLDMSAVGPLLGERVVVADMHDINELPVSGQRLLFVTPHCPGCATAKELLQESSLEALGGGVTILCRGTRTEVAAWAIGVPQWASVVLDEDGEVFSAFNVTVTPYYIRLDATGACVAKGVAQGTLVERPQGHGGSASVTEASDGLLASAVSASNGYKEER